MLDQVLTAFGVTPDYELNVTTPGQTLFQSTARILQALEQPLAESKPDLAVVQGDTTKTLGGALAAFYSGVPVAHEAVEAGAVRLVGTDTATIVRETTTLLDRASERIEAALRDYWQSAV